MNDGNLQAIDQTGQFLGDSEALELSVLYVGEMLLDRGGDAGALTKNG